MRKQWDSEWGDIDTEGNIWWLGSARKNWEAVMGEHVWEWFCEFPYPPPHCPSQCSCQCSARRSECYGRYSLANQSAL